MDEEDLEEEQVVDLLDEYESLYYSELDLLVVELLLQHRACLLPIKTKDSKTKKFNI